MATPQHITALPPNSLNALTDRQMATSGGAEGRPRFVPPIEDTGSDAPMTMNSSERQDNSSHGQGNSSGDNSSGRKKRERSNSLLASVPIEQVVNNFANQPYSGQPNYERSSSGGDYCDSFDMSSTCTDEQFQSSMSSVSVADLNDSWRNISMAEKVPFMKSRKTRGQDLLPHLPTHPNYGRRQSSPADFFHGAEAALALLGDSDSDDSTSDLNASAHNLTYTEATDQFGGHTQTGGKQQAAANAVNVANAVSLALMHRVDSSPAFFCNGSSEGIIFGHGTATMLSNPDSAINPSNETNPHEFFKEIVESFGFSSESLPALSVESYFIEHTKEQIAAYDNRITSAVRGEDIKALKQIHKEGRPLQCSNRFGETIVHMACRRGSVEILQFLLEDGNVSGLVRDDFGRTPMHDACWTREPEFEIVKMLTDRWPDLFLVSDKRGHTPLQYVRRDHWGKWCEFLTDYRDRLAPRAIAQKTC